MPIYKDKRGPNKWLVRVYHRGKPRSWTVNGTKAEATAFHDKKRGELALSAEGGSRTAPGFETFCVSEYRPHCLMHVSASTWKRRKYIVGMLAAHYGDKRLTKFAPADLVEYQLKRKEEGITASTINDEMVILGNVFRVARDKGYIAPFPKVRALKVRKTKGRVQVWSEAEVMRLYGAISATEPRLLGMVVMMINTGMRKGEVCAMEWSWVDLEERMLKIQPNESWRPKNGEPREVPLGSAVMRWIGVPAEQREHPRWVFPKQRKSKSDGHRYRAFPDAWFNAARDLAKVGGSPHVCRHTYASHFLKQQRDLFLLAQVLGHSHTRITKLYSHLLPDHLERARDAVNMAPPLMLGPGDDDE